MFPTQTTRAAAAILFLFPIFTSPLALFSNCGLDRPPPSSLHQASWPGPGPWEKGVCVSGWGRTWQLGLNTPGDRELPPSLGSSVGQPFLIPWTKAGKLVVAVGVPWPMTQFPHAPPLVLGWRFRSRAAVKEEKGDRRGCMRWVEWAVDTQVNKYLLFLSQTWLGRVRRGQGWAQPSSDHVHHGSRSDPQRPGFGVSEPAQPAGVFPGGCCWQCGM